MTTRVILGAGVTTQPGWTSLQESDLNFLHEQDFARWFTPASVDAFLAEHVWEHLTLAEGELAARHLFTYLKPGGYARIAVPDANFRNEAYQQLVQVGGPGPLDHPAASHKVVYDYRTLVVVFETAGFDVTLLEWCDEDGVFHRREWDEADGRIGRSYRFDTRNHGNVLGMVSIIIDARKPLTVWWEREEDDPLPPLTTAELKRLRTLVADLRQHEGEWGVCGGGEEIGPRTFTMPWVDTDPLAIDAMGFLYDTCRALMFDWAKWDEGRDIFDNWTDATPATLDHLTTRKLLTAVARNDRFCEGAWADLFESGMGVPLFERLLEHEEALASGA